MKRFLLDFLMGIAVPAVGATCVLGGAIWLIFSFAEMRENAQAADLECF